MIWALVSCAMLSAAPKQAIAVTRFRVVQVDPSLGGYAEDRLAARLAARGFQVSTPADLEAVLGLERQRQLLGCSEDTSCLAEISAALGVPLVATGRLTRLGKRLELDVRVIRQKDGVVIASDTRGTDDEARLGELLEQASESLAGQLLPKAAGAPFRWRLWVPFAAGIAALAGGGVLIGTAESEYASFTTAGGNPGVLANGEISDRYNALAARRGFGLGLGALGAALVATGFIWNALTPDSPVTVAVTLNSITVGARF
ncbi:MAG: hypothetical protein Q8L48_33805 [Archangium sp.]|nr:hypothetical protein [Archangium sp.]